ncbi:5'-Nucleotidase [Luminiphilus syltensis NOR5-1B]|uniref:5'-Nucleotidase n=1 Tax=Luminiphilus syltensis NOR5-1B TaxID=565045 RepID=B8KX49_9GAMM|nr:thiosulfohydrolase SoxB [Luminiphilus syltensis]EED35228.1 5'-Nucleotidase [Luminiphilus syltensis NOR5-1B]
MQRREFNKMLMLGAAAGLALPTLGRASASAGNAYDVPRFGNVHLLHTTDIHGQLNPIHYREPSVNIGIHAARNRPPHLVGEALLSQFGIAAGSREAHAFTYLDFVGGAEHFGKVGGFAHLATLVKRLKANRPGALLLDGGDLWQGSATALWSRGQDMVDASKLLGVDVMTGHWEFTLGADRVTEIIENDLAGQMDFVAHNVSDADFGDPVFEGHTLREINGVPVAIIGQAFPYTPIANPGYLTSGWTFGIQERELQRKIESVRADGAEVVVLLSHNGADVDLKLASRVVGLDAILGGHTHDGIPKAIEVENAGGMTLVTNAGSNGKFVGVLDFDVRDKKIRGWEYRLLPVFSDLLPADHDMSALIASSRAPYEEQLSEVLGTTDGLLYRRGNFNGSFDQVIVDALMTELDADIALSPGFRWGTTLLPGDTITMEDLMAQVAITYPATTLAERSGAEIKAILEDVADNLFNPDPYYQQGGDMVRVGGLKYSIDPMADAGKRINDMELGGKPLTPGGRYRVAGWASMDPNADGEPIWDVCARYLRSQQTLPPVTPNQPVIKGISDNKGISAA